MLSEIKNLRFWAVVGLAAASVGFIYIDVTGRAEVRASLMIATAPVGRVLYWADEVRRGEAERAELEERLTRENIAIGRADGLKRENDLLRSYRHVAGPVESELVFARVVGREVDTWRRVLVVDRGTADGVARGMPVIGTDGLVGYVRSAAESVSLVEIITSDQIRCAVEHSASGHAGLYFADETGTGHLSYFDRDLGVEVGDLIVTSGLSGKFPAGLIVGYVSDVRRPADLMYLEADVEPAQDLDATRSVFLMLWTPPEADVE
ncbi:MAG: rod shape-determining protein MreC [Candidatus Coatesbacteria bacterium]|nr:MAG: rod shape-determining protein MreC [Candidatus Coatesbacteria bacterium]